MHLSINLLKKWFSSNKIMTQFGEENTSSSAPVGSPPLLQLYVIEKSMFSGFGLGFERLILFATGMDSIRDVSYHHSLLFSLLWLPTLSSTSIFSTNPRRNSPNRIHKLCFSMVSLQRGRWHKQGGPSWNWFYLCDQHIAHQTAWHVGSTAAAEYMQAGGTASMLAGREVAGSAKMGSFAFIMWARQLAEKFRRLMLWKYWKRRCILEKVLDVCDCVDVMTYLLIIWDERRNAHLSWFFELIKQNTSAVAADERDYSDL